MNLPEGRALLDDAQRLAQRVQAAGEVVQGELSIAVPPEGAVDYLPKLLPKFHEEHPEVCVRISTAEGELGVLDLVRRPAWGRCATPLPWSLIRRAS